MRAKCLDCEHYYISFDRDNPKGCRAFGFKSKKMPSQVVRESSGTDCHNFELKERLRREKEKTNFNDAKYWKA